MSCWNRDGWRDDGLELSEMQIERYARNILVSGIGVEGQKKLLRSKVLVVGAGGLGVPVVLYLAAAGVGVIGVVDDDDVDITNLQRQVIYDTTDVGKKKVFVVKEKVEKLNPDVEVIPYDFRLTSQSAFEVMREYDMVVDCSDNFPTKYLVNDACVMLGKPLSHGAVQGFEGRLMTIIPKVSACYRCVLKKPPKPGSVPSCSEAGILGATAGVIGSLQAMEVIKYLTGAGELFTNRLLVFSGETLEFSTVEVERDERCPVCGEESEITELVDYDTSCRE